LKGKIIKRIVWFSGIGDWGLGPIPNPQSPIPNPQEISIRKIKNKKIYEKNII
jgi:hypothetical protein